MSIETVLKQWINDYSGIPNVIQMPFHGGRPTVDHVGFQIIGFNYSDFDEVDRAAKDATFITHNYKNNASLLLSVHAYGVKAYTALNALKLSLNNWESRNLLDTENMSLNSVDSVSNIAEFENTSFRDHWQGNFNFNIIINNVLDIHRINSWLLTGVWNDELGNEFLASNNNEFLVSNNNEFIVGIDTTPVLNSTIKYP